MPCVYIKKNREHRFVISALCEVYVAVIILLGVIPSRIVEVVTLLHLLSHEQLQLF